MTSARPSSPRELLLRWLGSRPKQTRCDWVVDPDRLVDWRDPHVVDETGRTWSRVLYTGDDIAFRWAFRKAGEEAEKAKRPLLIVVTKGSENPGPLDISHVTDILARAEGDPLDLSIVAFFKSIFPKVNPPQDALREYKHAFVENVPGLRRAYIEFKHRWGEPDIWGRDQFFAVLLLARHQDLRLDEVYCGEPRLLDCLAHICRLVMHPAFKVADYSLVWATIRESLHVRVADAEPWLAMEPSDLAGYLVLRDFAESQGLQNPAVQIMGKFPLRVDAEAMEPYALAVIGMLRRDPQVWDQVNRHAAVFLKDQPPGKILDLLGPEPQTLVKAALDERTSPVLMRDILTRVLRGFFANPSPDALAWTENLTAHPLLQRERLGDVHAESAALLGALIRLRRVEKCIAATVPTFADPGELLRWYRDDGVHLLELDVSEAHQGMDCLVDPDVHEAAETYFHALESGLRRRTRSYLDTVDRQLAAFIAADPRAFALGPQSAIRILPDTVGHYSPGDEKGRTWILVFDGMRLDTWERVVRPLLMEHFEIIDDKEDCYFCVLPSSTSEARRALLAGALRDQWLAPTGKATQDERLLVARRLGLTSQQLDRLRFVTDAQTTEARRRLGFSDTGSPPFNVLIYPISDDLAHYHGDTLSGLNARIRMELLGDRSLRGILDDMLRRIAPQDVVLVTSDHGFIELLPDRATTISSHEVQAAGGKVEDAVQYRHLVNFDRDDLEAVVRVQWDANLRYMLAVGGQWFRREQGRAPRYAHGGVSMSEMVVPGALMCRITEKLARVEYEDVPESIEVSEDEAAAIRFSLANVGNVDVDVTVTAATNLGEVILEASHRLAPGSKHKIECEVIGRYAADSKQDVITEKITRSVVLSQSHSDPSGRMQEPPNGRRVIPVTVRPKAMRIETEALEGFDDV
jgi:hypothetical protein